MRAVLCVGLRSEAARFGTVAPRVVTEEGEVIVGAPLTASGTTPRDVTAHRATYLAGLTGPGLFDAEVASDGVLVIGGALAPLGADEVPDFLNRILTERKWTAPGMAPARARPLGG
jgi:hypothetical protein